MGLLKRLAFYVGLVLGVAAVAVAGTVALTYLFTGKFTSIEAGQEGTKVTLMTADEIVALIRQQVDKAKAAQSGGETDVEG